MTLTKCYNIAKSSRIEIYRCKSKRKACCVSLDHNIDAIGLNYPEIKSEREEKMLLSEELGHCCSGAYYTDVGNEQLNIANIKKAEYNARQWQIKKLIPMKKLKRAIKDGYNTVFELSEYFDVTEDLIHDALDVYHDALENMLKNKHFADAG